MESISLLVEKGRIKAAPDELFHEWTAQQEVSTQVIKETGLCDFDFTAIHDNPTRSLICTLEVRDFTPINPPEQWQRFGMSGQNYARPMRYNAAFRIALQTFFQGHHQVAQAFQTAVDSLIKDVKKEIILQQLVG